MIFRFQTLGEFGIFLSNFSFFDRITTEGDTFGTKSIKNTFPDTSMDSKTHVEASVTVCESRIESSVFVPSQGDHLLPYRFH